MGNTNHLKPELGDRVRYRHQKLELAALVAQVIDDDGALVNLTVLKPSGETMAVQASMRAVTEEHKQSHGRWWFPDVRAVAGGGS